MNAQDEMLGLFETQQDEIEALTRENEGLRERLDESMQLCETLNGQLKKSKNVMRKQSEQITKLKEQNKELTSLRN